MPDLSSLRMMASQWNPPGSMTTMSFRSLNGLPVTYLLAENENHPIKRGPVSRSSKLSAFEPSNEGDACQIAHEQLEGLHYSDEGQNKGLHLFMFFFLLSV